jgi:hypothetical protein
MIKKKLTNRCGLLTQFLCVFIIRMRVHVDLNVSTYIGTMF